MDLLRGLSLEDLSVAIWVCVAVFAAVMGIWQRRQLQWVALSSVVLFAVLNAGTGIYVLRTVGDSRWAQEGTVPLSAPSLSETPLVGQYLDPLNSALQSMVGSVNSLVAFQQALPVALDFFTKSGWALLIAVPLMLLVVVMSYRAARRRKRELNNYRATVDQLKIDLEQVKARLTMLDGASSLGEPTAGPPQASRRDQR
ncbi:hypothetical protein ACFO7V_09180 [Glutamicibacter bergerei]|uniref:Uncharacterized protein n=2 Tax=Glutamicibacter TaxID=1742989 RepID=A0ABV9MKA4_9MICC|nr:hypothetical protein GCM10007173_14870 [Glutamicibacter ardleyensis]HBV09705.1 hypothetical protein [Micrococcaceae bacterium]